MKKFLAIILTLVSLSTSTLLIGNANNADNGQNYAELSRDFLSSLFPNIYYTPGFVRECSKQILNDFNKLLNSNANYINLSDINNLLKKLDSCVNKHIPGFSDTSANGLQKDLLICVAELYGKSVFDNNSNILKSEFFCKDIFQVKNLKNPIPIIA